MNLYRHKWWVLIGFGLGVSMLNLDLTIVNLALPVIGAVFHISLTNLQWINNSFMLGTICITLLSGYLSNHCGRRNVFLWGIVVFLLGSLLAGIAGNTGMIVTGRVLQGIGIGSAFPMTLILINESFPEHQRGMAMGLMSGFAGFSQAAGPTVGGFIVQYLGWRWTFFINLFIGPVVIGIIWKYCLAGGKGDVAAKPLSYSSLILLNAGIVAILCALNEIHQWGIFSPLFLSIFGAGLLILIFSLYQQTHLAYPLVDLSLFHNSVYRAINIIRPIFQFVFFGFYFLVPLYLQNILNYSPAQSGLIILFMSLIIGILSPVAGRCIDAFGVRIPIITSQISGIIGTSLFIFTTPDFNFWIVGFGLLCMGISTGLMFSPSNFTAVNALPPEKKTIGLGVYIIIMGILASMGIAITGTLISALSEGYFHQSLLHHGLQQLEQRAEIQNIVSGAAPLASLGQWVNPQQLPLLTPIIKASFLYALHWSMALFAILTAFGLLFSHCLPHKKRSFK